MSATREQVMEALLARLTAKGTFVTVGRRNRAPESFTPAETPALMLVEHSELYRSPSTNQPAIRELMVKVIIYSDVGTDENAIPAAPVNDALDALDAALQPDNLMNGFLTLGGLVQSVIADGPVIKAPGDVTGKSLAVVPLTITLP